MSEPGVNNLFDATATPQAATWQSSQTTPWKTLGESIRDVDAPASELGLAQAPSREAWMAQMEASYQQRLEVMQKSVQAAQEAYREAVARLADAPKSFGDAAEQELVNLAIYIAEQVMASDLQARRDFVVQMARQAIASMHDAQKIVLNVSPDDMQGLLKHLPQPLLQDRNHFDVREDASLTLGGIVATCEGGRFDADLRSRLDAVAKQLRAAASGMSHV